MALQYVGTLSQGDVTGKEKMYVASSSGVIGPGDAVRITGTADADGIATVDLGPANTGSTGVVSSILPIFSGESLSTTWAPASTAVKLLVNCDPMALYEADVSNGPLTAVDVGLNVPLVATVGTVSGSLFTSNMGVNATGKATTNTLPFQVVRLLVGSDGVLGSRALVRMNATTSTYGATGV